MEKHNEEPERNLDMLTESLDAVNS